MTTSGRSRARWLWPAAVLWIASGTVRGADDASYSSVPLAELVAADVGLSIETHDLWTHAEQFWEGPLYRRWQQFPAWQAWDAEHGRELRELEGKLGRQLQAASADRWPAGLLGGDALFAVWPPSQGGGAEGEALLLVRAPDAALLGRAADLFVAELRRTHRLVASHTWQIGNRTCTAYEIDSDSTGSSVYLVVDGPLGLVANRESLIRGALGRRDEGAAGSLAELPAYVTAASTWTDDHAVRIFLNARPWDELLAAEVRSAPPRDAATKQTVFEVWKATESWTLVAEFGARVAVEIQWRAEVAQLPKPVGDVLVSLSGRAAMLDAMPRTALAAAAGRLDVAPLLDVLEAIGNPGTNGGVQRAPAGVNPVAWAMVRGLAVGLGGDFGGCLAAAPFERGVEGDAGGNAEPAPPLDVIVAASVRDRWPEADQPPAAALELLVRTGVSMFVLGYNDRRKGEPNAQLATQTFGTTSVTSVTGLEGCPLGVAPSYTMAGDVFWAGLSPSAVGRAVDRSGETLGGSEPLAALLGPRLADPSHVFYLDLAGLREWLAARPQVAEWLSTATQLDAKAARKSWSELRALLQLADAFLIAARFDESGLAASIVISADGPDRRAAETPDLTSE